MSFDREQRGVVRGIWIGLIREGSSLAAIGEVVGFSGWLLANNLIQFLRNRSDQLILAKLLGAGTLGIYSVAFDIASLIGVEALAPIRRVLLPGYSKISGDQSQYCRPSTMRGSSPVPPVPLVSMLLH